MKFKTTRKALKEQFGKDIFYVHMNSPKRLFNEPQAYITRVEGWACDVWIFTDLVITEGYSPMGRAIDFDICRKYEERARKILDNKWSYNRQQKQIEKIREDFLNYVRSEYNVRV